MQSYWDSPEAKALFRAQNDERVLNALHRRLKSLREAVATYDRYKGIMQEFSSPDGRNRSELVKLSEYDIFQIWMKCFYMIALYQIVEDDMSSNTFTECFKKASLLCRQQGWKSINKFTVMKWHQSYRVKW